MPFCVSGTHREGSKQKFLHQGLLSEKGVCSLLSSKAVMTALASPALSPHAPSREVRSAKRGKNQGRC